MAVTFTKRKGKVVGMNMSFAEMRCAYFKLTGKVIPKGAKCTDKDFQTAGAEMMSGYTESQIRAAAESFYAEREEFFSGRSAY